MGGKDVSHYITYLRMNFISRTQEEFNKQEQLKMTRIKCLPDEHRFEPNRCLNSIIHQNVFVVCCGILQR
jgi:hypothetical protein